MAACAIWEGLTRIYMIADASADDALRLYFDYAYDILKGNMEHKLDIERIEMLRQDFLKEQEKKRKSTK